VTIDEIVQKIYEERYQGPKDPEIATYMRDVMIREVVVRALELATGSLAIDLVAARRDRAAAHEAVTSWMKEAGARGDLVQAGQAPGWAAYERAEAAWHAVVAKLDGWIVRGKEQP
jgi:hypothetical protein